MDVSGLDRMLSQLRTAQALAARKPAAKPAEEAPAAAEGGFAGVLKSSLNEVARMQNDATQAAKNFTVGVENALDRAGRGRVHGLRVHVGDVPLIDLNSYVGGCLRDLDGGLLQARHPILQPDSETAEGDRVAVAVPEGAALGAAFGARLAAGLETSLADGSRWAKRARTVEPDARALDVVADRYDRWSKLAG